MKIALLGYGKMGMEIEKIALALGHEIGLKVNHLNLQDLTIENLKKVDVAIEFSTPNTVVENINLCFEAGIPIVVGTTAWQNKLEEVRNNCELKNGALFFSSNFSIGVNLFFELNKLAGEMMNAYSDYNVFMDEVHHTQKMDAPSGTAITTAEKILSTLSRKNKWSNKIVLEENQFEHTNLKENELMIHSIRKESVPGTHVVYFDSDVDVLEIKHIAKNRKGFAIGAVKAAEWMIGRKGIFGMKDLLGF